MDPDLQRLLALDEEENPKLIFPLTDAQLFLKMPTALIDAVISYVDSVGLKNLFNTCKSLREHLQKVKYWADFKVRILSLDTAEQMKEACRSAYYICFHRKYIDIYHAQKMIKLAIWRELIIYFGVWEIDCDLTEVTTYTTKKVSLKSSKMDHNIVYTPHMLHSNANASANINTNNVNVNVNSNGNGIHSRAPNTLALTVCMPTLTLILVLVSMSMPMLMPMLMLMLMSMLTWTHH
ncbi:hypothetical protein RFI_18242 [Reticulomyxa filosa]|uniref:F-box domain-containing protein n=1 Tax=Reticulomyxa filosa TaxID=46433 RepID=X6MYA7_RETFI|nr:hypothetical protein RFI_18242 [Reticulomyxa filosa]|eukprot:ETO19005.1 hypothetical protein RFI_18242 [Reticulomyxa filosa]